MAHNTSKTGKVIKRLTAFVGLPLIFVFIAYFIIYLIAGPVIAPASSLLSMLIGDSEPTFTDSEIADDVQLDFVSLSEHQEDTLFVDDIDLPEVGEKYAHITIPDTGVDCDVYYGDSKKNLRKGPGQYERSKLPGFGSTTLVAAHVTTHFNGLQHVEIGDIIQYQTTYGAYEYEVTDIKIVKASEAASVYDLRADYDNLMLYTCYPFHSVAFRSQRYFVCAKMISGPKVNIYE